MRRLTAMAAGTAVVLALLAVAEPVARPAETGLDLTYQEVRRGTHHDVPDANASTVLRRRGLLHWQPIADDDRSLRVVAEREDYRLAADDGGKLIGLRIDKVNPRYRRETPRWALDAAVIVAEFRRQDAVYTPIGPDDEDRFYLPALVGDFTPEPLLFRLGAWEEYEILTLDYNQYSIAVVRHLLAGAGYRFGADVTVRAEVSRVERTYPAELPQEDQEYALRLRWSDPLARDEEAIWREFSAVLTRSHYVAAGDVYHELTVASVFRLASGSATHYVTTTAIASDSFVVYRQGALPESLVEDTVSDPDLTLRLEYEGFVPLGGGPWFLVWGGNYHRSVVQGVQTGMMVHARLTYTY